MQLKTNTSALQRTLKCHETPYNTKGQCSANVFLVVNPATSRLMEINPAARNQTAKNRKFRVHHEGARKLL